jgi:hypothetical protein
MKNGQVITQRVCFQVNWQIHGWVRSLSKAGCSIMLIKGLSQITRRQCCKNNALNRCRIVYSIFSGYLWLYALVILTARQSGGDF